MVEVESTTEWCRIVDGWGEERDTGGRVKEVRTVSGSGWCHREVVVVVVMKLMLEGLNASERSRKRAVTALRSKKEQKNEKKF